ncbi:MAG: hypothetical protein IT206_09305 [Fimbriimonadaceae bacterium]|nr:hypothetical protein [Fimbriimonadaceae bacterium]
MPLSESETGFPTQWPEEALARAQGHLARLVREWDLELGNRFTKVYCSLVYATNRGIMKVPVIGEELTTGYQAMLAYDGHGGVPVLRHDDEASAVLMPQLGENLESEPEEKAVVIAAEAIQRLWSAPAFATTPLVGWYSDTVFVGSDGVLYEHLLATMKPRPLHGDLHHFNLLRSGDEWLAIDPKGMLGDPAWECAAFLRNPAGRLPSGPELGRLLRRRVEMFSALLVLPPNRIAAWGYLDAVSCDLLESAEALRSLL